MLHSVDVVQACAVSLCDTPAQPLLIKHCICCFICVYTFIHEKYFSSILRRRSLSYASHASMILQRNALAQLSSFHLFFPLHLCHRRRRHCLTAAQPVAVPASKPIPSIRTGHQAKLRSRQQRCHVGVMARDLHVQLAVAAADAAIAVTTTTSCAAVIMLHPYAGSLRWHRATRNVDRHRRLCVLRHL